MIISLSRRILLIALASCYLHISLIGQNIFADFDVICVDFPRDVSAPIRMRKRAFWMPYFFINEIYFEILALTSFPFGLTSFLIGLTGFLIWLSGLGWANWFLDTVNQFSNLAYRFSNSAISKKQLADCKAS